MYAWITSVSKEDQVSKGLLLGGSLNRVRSAVKRVVFAASDISKASKAKLRNAFHFVIEVNRNTAEKRGEDDVSLRAKILAFSLLIFDKCVYLSPNTLVLRNCDHLFDKHNTFALLADKDEVDPTAVYLFTPSLQLHDALEQRLSYENWETDFVETIRNHVANLETLDDSYNVNIFLQENSSAALSDLNACIVNFGDHQHPLDLRRDYCTSLMSEMVGTKKVAVELCWSILEEGVGIPRPLLTHLNNTKEPIAIVGMSFRLPGANNPDEFWNLLAEGRHAIQKVPSHRWTPQHTMAPWKNRDVQAGFLSCPIHEFDTKFFGISTKEAVLLDPQQRLLHEVTWEAFEDAGIDPSSVYGTSTGFFVGSWMYNYRDITAKCVNPDFFRTYTGNSIAASSARLSHFFGTTGPSIATESGCSSAIVAVDMAIKALRNRDTSLALACGVNLLLHPCESSLLEGILAPDYRCKTFDSNADGFVRAEGCATLVLKRLSDAVKEDNKIWGLLRGSAITQEGLSKSLGTPTVSCESEAMKLALKDSGVEPSSVDYIETHGTGTSVGDPMEVAAINAAYYSQGRTRPIVIGSVKTNVGHTESVSGITGIIKVVLAMKHDKLPKHLNLDQVNPAINLDVVPLQIPLENMAWPKDPKRTRLAGVSSFGISGTDGHCIVEEPPEVEMIKAAYGLERPLHILKLSAKCQESFDELTDSYAKLLESQDLTPFSDIAFSANTGRASLSQRAVIIARESSDAAKMLREKTFRFGDISAPTARLCFLFTGQGSQYLGMAQQLYSTSPVFKLHFDSCDRILREKYDVSIRDVMWGGKGGDHLDHTLYSQTAIFCVEYCLLKLWESWGVKPDYVMGHSLGEFAAAVAAGALDFEDGLMLVAERSKLIDSLPTGKMLVIKANKKVTEQTILKFKDSCPSFWVDYAAVNSPDQTVVAGDSEMIQKFASFCAEKSLKAIVLASTHAFHSRHMDPMLEAYRKVASAIKTPMVQEGSPKYISGMEGKLIDIQHIDADYWVRHTREKVSFMDACKVVQSEGCTLFLEIGPHPVLSALTMMNMEGTSVKCLPSIRRQEDNWVTLLESLGRLYLSNWRGTIDWKGLDSCYQRSRVTLPFYPFSRKSIWVDIRPDLPIVHPLIGRHLPVATNSSVFQNELTIKGVPFSQDHVFGNTVVFPGAGLLEMCLAAGYSSAHGFHDELSPPRRGVALTELKIATPLALHDSPSALVQTITKLEGESSTDGYEVGVYRHDDGGSWITHATAKFHPVLSTSASGYYLPPNGVNIPTIQSTWERVDYQRFYETVSELGLKFGPKFHSLQAGWRGGGQDEMLVELKIPQDPSYLIHPIVADAMIQVALLLSSKSSGRKRLQVPLSVGEFVYLQNPISARFIYSRVESTTGKIGVYLVDSEGQTLAYMGGIEFVETTLKMLEGMIKQQSSKMPKLWEEVWKVSGGPLQNRMEPIGAPLVRNGDSLQLELARYNEMSPMEQKFHRDVTSFTRLSVVSALYSCGWKPEVAKVFSVDDLISELGLSPEFTNYIRFFLRSLAGQRILKMEEGSERQNLFWFGRELPPPPTPSEVRRGLEEIEKQGYSSSVVFKFATELGSKLADLFLGRVQPLPILFPEDPSKIGLSRVYEALSETTVEMGSELNEKATLPAFHKVIELSKRKTSNPVLRVLEVGSGTGVYTRRILSFLDEHSIPYEFYYTDISAAFFGPAEKQYGGAKGVLHFRKLDMEKDPLEQGFCPGYFDIMFACEVLHVAKDMRETLKRLRCLLKEGGIMQIIETIAEDETITFIFGLLEGYWNFQDFELRPYHATLSPDRWTLALEDSGYTEVACTPAYMNVRGTITAVADGDFSLKHVGPPKHVWSVFVDDGSSELGQMLIQKLESVNRRVAKVGMPHPSCGEEEMKTLMRHGLELWSGAGEHLEGVIYLWGMSNTRDQSKVSLPLFTLCQLLAEVEKPPKVFVVTEGVHPVDDVVLNPSPGTLVGLIRAVNNELPNLNLSHFDLSPQDPIGVQTDQVFYNLWTTSNEEFAFRAGSSGRLSYKIAAWTMPNSYLSLPNGCDRWQLALPQSRQISDLEFTFLEHYTLAEDEIEVEVKATGLNFRDVLTVLKPIVDFETYHAVGVDFAGVVTKVGANVKFTAIGDRVLGTRMDRDTPLPSHIKIKEALALHIPTSMTFTEGATLGLVFLTTYYSLIVKAGMKLGDRILVHTASGGVGLCAIQLAKLVGAEVIATAGNSRKRTVLRRRLGVSQVFNSRTTEFGPEVVAATGGIGVDIVLNTLTGPGFKEASLDALKENGQFIELSVLNIWTSEEVQKLRPDVGYHLVDLSKMSVSQMEEMGREAFRKYLDQGWVTPIPYERFDALNIRGALSYLQKAKHVGKLVCVMPDNSGNNNTPLFNEQSTYLVTGGLGGIGFEVVKWILKRGGRHVVIASRREPQTETREQIEGWNKSVGNNVQAFQVDVGDMEQCLKLFENIQNNNFPPLRGVFHAAGVLADGILQNQSWDRFNLTYNPKVGGSWNLHELTKDLLLEQFVLFSSISATFGSPGQANHSSSNSFEDALASYRYSLGLPATSINWANWGEVGIATEIDFPGLHPISTEQGLLALEMFLRTQRRNGAVANVDSFGLLAKVFPRVKGIVEDKRLLGDQKIASTFIINSDEFWTEVDSAGGDREGRVSVFKKYIKSTVRNILKSDPDEVIDDHVDFSSIGVDSLMMLEMKNALQSILGSRMTITATQLKDCNTVSLLANKLVRILEGEADERMPSAEELKLLVREDSRLPEEIRLEEDLGDLKEITKVGSILLTGATGNLGPYLLRELCRREHVTKVYCLVRKSKNGVKDKLKTKLEKMGLLEQVDLSKVECVEGDISKSDLGVSSSTTYSTLAGSVDAIIHCAVKADHTAKYWLSPESHDTVRTVNVLGTRRILQFAVDSKLKHVFYASSCLSVTSVDEDGRFSESWQDVGAFDQVPTNPGYALSKHVSELLCQQAITRGIPCKVVRLPFLGGESDSGRIDFKSSHFYLRYLAILKLRCMPDVPLPMSTIPVDTCAALSLQLFFHPEARSDVYNVIHRNPNVDQVLLAVAQEEFGIHIELISHQAFVDKIKADETSPLAPFKGLYSDESEHVQGLSVTCLQKYMENSDNFFKAEKILPFIPTFESTIIEPTHVVLRRDLRFMKDHGVFQLFGIECD